MNSLISIAILWCQANTATYSSLKGCMDEVQHCITRKATTNAKAAQCLGDIRNKKTNFSNVLDKLAGK